MSELTDKGCIIMDLLWCTIGEACWQTGIYQDDFVASVYQIVLQTATIADVLVKLLGSFLATKGVQILFDLTVSELQWGHAEMIFHVSTKEGGIGKGEFVTNLLDTEICLPQVVADVFQHLFCNPFVSGLARILLADSCQVFG
jgi:hypothetical protein